MKTYNSKLQTNNTTIQSLINLANSLPEEKVLDTLDNPGTASDLLSPKELLDSEGKKIVGTMTNNGTISQTMDGIDTKSISIPKGYTDGGTVSLDNTIDNEVSTQNDLIEQIKVALDGKAGGGGSSEDSDTLDALISGSITEISNNRVTKINNYAFYDYKYLTSVNFPKCGYIDNYAFYRCSSLSSINFPICAIIGNYAFQFCISLASVSFPECTIIGSSAFYQCTSLTIVNFPQCTRIDKNAFQICRSLTTADFSKCIGIETYAFLGCYNLTTLILGASMVCTLSNSNAFSSTPIGGYSTSVGKYGTIYVPASLLASYQAATNWTYFSSRFSTIESLTQ